MQLMRRQDIWDPFREMQELTNRFTRLFGMSPGISAGEQEALATTDWSPACDIVETDKEYLVRAELPHVKKDDVHVMLEGGVLTIQGERKQEKEEKNARYHRRELSYGSFVRRFSMPDDIDESSVDATFKDGILSVVVGKSKERQTKSREIAVH